MLDFTNYLNEQKYFLNFLYLSKNIMSRGYKMSFLKRSWFTSTGLVLMILRLLHFWQMNWYLFTFSFYLSFFMNGGYNLVGMRFLKFLF